MSAPNRARARRRRRRGRRRRDARRAWEAHELLRPDLTLAGVDLAVTGTDSSAGLAIITFNAAAGKPVLLTFVEL